MLKERYENIYFEDDDLRKKDYLGNLQYAEILEYKVEEYFNSDNSKPLYIALTGTWGSGKTTVANTVIEKFESDGKNNIHIFRYDSWKYEGDSFRRTFTNSILKQSGLNQNSSEVKQIKNEMYEDKSIETQSFIERIKLSKHKDTSYYSKPAIIGACILTAVSVVLSILIPDKIIYAFCFAISLLSYLGALNMLYANVTYTTSKLFSPEQFYDSVKNILLKVKEKNKIFLIDNLDRCSEKELVETMSSIKGFFDLDGKVVYIVPFDVEQFDKAFKNEYQRYAEKIFDYTIDIKENSKKNIIEFVDTLLNDFSNYKALFPNTTIDIISKSNCKTPRQILYICNSYITEYNLYVNKNKLKPNDIQEEDLNYLMKYTILKINFKDLFNRIHLDIDIIRRLEFLAKGRNSYKDSAQKEFAWLEEEQYNFLLRTYSVIPNKYSLFYSNQNSETFKIDSDLENAIYERNFEKLSNYMATSDKEKKEIMSYLSKSIIYEMSKGLWETSITSKLELVIYLLQQRQEVITIEEVNSSLDTLIKNDRLFDEIIYKKRTSLDNAIFFINTYVDKYKNKFDLKNKLLKGLVNKYFGYTPEEELISSSKIFIEIEMDKLSEQENHFFSNHIDLITNSQAFKQEPHSRIFSSKVSKYIKDGQFIVILNNTSQNDSNIFKGLIDCIDKKFEDNVDNGLFSTFISFVNRISPYVNDKNTFKEIFELLRKYKDNQSWPLNIPNLNISIPNEAVCPDLYKSVFEVLLNINNTSLTNVLLNLRIKENKDIIMSSILDINDFKAYLTLFIQSFIANMTNEEFGLYIADMTKLYSKTDNNFKVWFRQHLLNQRQNHVVIFYENITNHEEKEEYINDILSKPLTPEQDIVFIDLYESDLTRYESLLLKSDSLQVLEKTLNNTDKAIYKNMASKAIIDKIDCKNSIINDEVDVVCRLLSSSIVTPSNKKKILSLIVVNKMNPTDLRKTYESIDKSFYSTNEYAVLESLLIENGSIDSRKATSKNHKASKTIKNK